MVKKVRGGIFVSAAVVTALAVSLLTSTQMHQATGVPDKWGASTKISGSAAAAAGQPNIFIYNLDDLRDAFPGAIDPMAFMPKTMAWMSGGTRYANTFVAEPSCCPSRSSLMTGRYPHNNGVRIQSQGPAFDFQHSMACYLQAAGYRTYLDGKFLTTWPRTQLPPCFTHSTVMWGGYFDVGTRVDGTAKKSTGYSTTVLGVRGREYVTEALSHPNPFLLYEAPQAPHWVDVTNPDGTKSQLAIPEQKYATANVGNCAGVPESDRADKPAYVRRTSFTTAQGQAMCQSQLRAIMTADDEFDMTMQQLSNTGVLDNTMVILTSDNGYNWGEHGRTEKFVPYEPSLRVPLLVRWPGHVPSGTSTRLVSYIDLLPTMLAAANVTIPAAAPRLDGESLLGPTSRTTVFAEYYKDSANGNVPTWKAIRTSNVKYIQTYDATGAITFREYYNLTNDPAENVNLLRDGNAGNDPPQSELNALTTQLNALATCSGSSCVR